MDLVETKIDSTTVYNGRVVKLRVDTVRLPDGTTSKREVIDHSGAVGMIPLLSNGNIILVKQFRYAVGKTILEIPAGKIDAGEQPIDCAARELEEEIKLHPQFLTKLNEAWYATGYCSEKIHLYLATGLSPFEAELDRDEFLEIVEIPFGEAYGMAITGNIEDGKTALGIILAYNYWQNVRKFME